MVCNPHGCEVCDVAQVGIPAELLGMRGVPAVALRRSSPFFTLLRGHAALAANDSALEPSFAAACTGDAQHDHRCGNPPPLPPQTHPHPPQAKQAQCLTVHMTVYKHSIFVIFMGAVFGLHAASYF